MHYPYRPLVAALLLCSAAGPALSKPDPADKLEEVIVTANYRDMALMDTVGSISVVGQETIERTSPVCGLIAIATPLLMRICPELP